MIDNPNPNNFYSPEEMVAREKYIPKIKADLLKELEDLTNKIKNEQAFPHGNMDLEFISKTLSGIEKILDNWYY